MAAMIFLTKIPYVVKSLLASTSNCKIACCYSTPKTPIATCRNTSQHGGQTHSTCCAQQCCDILRWLVAIVWTGLSHIKSRPNDDNISTQKYATCCVWPPCCDMLGVVGSNLTISKFEPTTPNMMLQHVPTRWPNVIRHSTNPSMVACITHLFIV